MDGHARRVLLAVSVIFEYVIVVVQIYAQNLHCLSVLHLATISRWEQS